MSGATDRLFQIAIIIISVVIHEVSHGIAAYIQGDKTAYYHGRLTLNPIPHLDPFGSVILPILSSFALGGFFIGYAKPVPYNPYNLRNQKWGPAIVGLAGPASNILLALVFGLIVRAGTAGFLGFIPPTSLQSFLNIAFMIMAINIFLTVLNMLPIPPLDGSKFLHAVFPRQAFRLEAISGRYGILIIFPVLLIMLPIVGYISEKIINLIIG